MGRKESTSGFEDSLERNVMTYDDYYTRFMIIACTLFKWNGLPETISERFLERTLFLKGIAVFHKDPELGLMISKAVSSGPKNVYEEPTGYKAFSIGYTRDVTAEECVLIRNNVFDIPTHRMIYLYARRLADLERTIDTNIQIQKHPIMILCDENERFSIEQLMMKVEGNIPFIVGTKNIDMTDRVKTFNTGTPYIADKLQETKEVLINELYTRLGLNNANTDKRERLVVDEVNANNEIIGINYLTMLETRTWAAAKISEMFREELGGKAVTVSLRFKQLEESKEEEEPEDGKVHNDD